MSDRSNRRLRQRVQSVLGISALLFSFALPQTASAVFVLGGIDAESQYTGAGKASLEAGVLTFDDDGNGWAAAEPGVVTSGSVGLEALFGHSVAFEVVLGPNKPNGSPFDPATGFPIQARFLGVGSYGFKIYDGANTLLAFDIAHIDVKNVTTPNASSPTGTITLGDATVGAASSLLTLTGGSLNALVGGIGSTANLHVRFITLTPSIPSFLAPGYLNDNFTSGVGAVPVSTSVWDLSIVPIPEPGTASLFGLALVGLVGFARRRAAAAR